MIQEKNPVTPNRGRAKASRWALAFGFGGLLFSLWPISILRWWTISSNEDLSLGTFYTFLLWAKPAVRLFPGLFYALPRHGFGGRMLAMLLLSANWTIVGAIVGYSLGKAWELAVRSRYAMRTDDQDP